MTRLSGLIVLVVIAVTGLPALAWANDAFDDLLSRGQAHAESGEFATALSLFQRASELDPEHAGVQARIAAVAVELGQPDVGLAALERFEQLRPGDAEHPRIIELRRRLTSLAAPPVAAVSLDVHTAKLIVEDMQRAVHARDARRVRGLAQEARKHLALGIVDGGRGDRRDGRRRGQG